MGRNRVSPLEMGMRGGVGYPRIPRLEKPKSFTSEDTKEHGGRSKAGATTGVPKRVK
jgi:hypothetical protein